MVTTATAFEVLADVVVEVVVFVVVVVEVVVVAVVVVVLVVVVEVVVVVVVEVVVVVVVVVVGGTQFLPSPVGETYPAIHEHVSVGLAWSVPVHMELVPHALEQNETRR